jgi:hypothetical protein
MAVHSRRSFCHDRSVVAPNQIPPDFTKSLPGYFADWFPTLSRIAGVALTGRKKALVAKFRELKER